MKNYGMMFQRGQFQGVSISLQVGLQSYFSYQDNSLCYIWVNANYLNLFCNTSVLKHKIGLFGL